MLFSLRHTFSGAPASNVSISMAYNAAGQLSTRAIDKDVYAYAGHYNVDLTSMHNALNQTASVSRASPAQTTTFAYDALGNLTCDKFSGGSCQTGSGGMALAYDNDNQLTSVTTSAGTKTLRQMEVGRLYEVKTSPSVLTRFAYAGSAIIAEYDAAGVVLRRHIPGPGVDETIATLEGSGTTDIRRLITDERGSIIGITNAAGTSVSPLTYDAYGKPGASNTGRFQYTGQAWIGELGLYYYKARFYSPNIGRFLQTDPIGYADGMNLYAYVGGDPVNFTDPSGLKLACVTVDNGQRHCRTVAEPADPFPRPYWEFARPDRTRRDPDWFDAIRDAARLFPVRRKEAEKPKEGCTQLNAIAQSLEATLSQLATALANTGLDPGNFSLVVSGGPSVGVGFGGEFAIGAWFGFDGTYGFVMSSGAGAVVGGSVGANATIARGRGNSLRGAGFSGSVSSPLGGDLKVGLSKAADGSTNVQAGAGPALPLLPLPSVSGTISLSHTTSCQR